MYAYVVAGRDGLVIADIERPQHPVVNQVYTRDGAIDDASAVKVGMTDASLFAYVADGHNGLRVTQVTSADTPGNQGFSPRPRPYLPDRDSLRFIAPGRRQSHCRRTWIATVR